MVLYDFVWVNKEIMETIQNNLGQQVSGAVILPSDPNYDEARKIYNAMIDKRPAIILKCANAEDVEKGMNYARENKMEMSVKSGGHNGAGIALVYKLPTETTMSDWLI